MSQVDGGRDVDLDERGVVAEEGIQVLFAWVSVVDVRHGLVNEVLKPMGAHPSDGSVHHLDHHGGVIVLEGNEPAAVGEAAVGIERVAVHTGGQQGTRLAIAQGYQRAVGKTVAVIVHIAALMQESRIAARPGKFVPSGSHRGVISDNLYHNRIRFDI